MEKVSGKNLNPIYINKSMEKLSKSELLQIIFMQNENVELLTKKVNELTDR